MNRLIELLRFSWPFLSADCYLISAFELTKIKEDVHFIYVFSLIGWDIFPLYDLLGGDLSRRLS
jgi:hypothetical protein